MLRWARSRASWWLWGYGEHWLILTRNYLLLGLVVFPVLFYGLRQGLQVPSGTNELVAILTFSLELLLPAGIDSGVIPVSGWTRFVAALETVVGVIAIGLFGAYVLRWSLRR